MTPEEIKELKRAYGLGAKNYEGIIAALKRGEFLSPDEAALYAGRHACEARSEALEEATTIADHHAEVHDTAAKCHEAVSQDSDSKRSAWGHKEASQCAAKIADDIRAVLWRKLTK